MIKMSEGLTKSIGDQVNQKLDELENLKNQYQSEIEKMQVAWQGETGNKYVAELRDNISKLDKYITTTRDYAEKIKKISAIYTILDDSYYNQKIGE